MKIAIATMNVKAGKCEENFLYMEQKIKEAIKEQVEIIVFPQNAISGYLLGDQWLEDAWCRYVDSFNAKIVAYSQEIAIVWGNIKYRNKRRFNAAFFAYQGHTYMRVRKNCDVDYMQDSKYFENNDINSAITYNDKVFAMNFHDEITFADLNINLDACPYDMDKTQAIKGNVLYVNAVGMQNTGKNVMVMQGGSYLMKDSKCLYQAPYFKEDFVILDTKHASEVMASKPQLLDALALGIKEFDRQVFGGNIPWVVGLSGGLDSSVTCALLAYSLGSERLYGYNLATKYNSNQTINNAAQEAQALGIHYKEGSIESFVQASNAVFKDEYGHDVEACSSLVLENIQARARGYLLTGFAGILGGVVVNNANKVEAALGYCTLYGDSVGAISLIGDLTKVQLFALSRQLNAYYEKEVIPTCLLPDVEEDTLSWSMPPSAELKDNQYDPMKWFYHDYLVDHLGKDLSVIEFMQSYLDNTLQEGELKRWITHYKLDNPEAFIADLEWFLGTVQRNSFKSLQLPPLLTLHTKTFANKINAQMKCDQQMYAKLKMEILQKH